MRLLLDSHVFLWLDAEPTRLSTRVRLLCEDESNTIYLSLANIWEL